MNYRIAIYCPDHHLLYDGRTPDDKGVGGGVMARLRLAQALSRMGHRVTVIANVTRSHTDAGVTYQPLSQAKQVDCDVFISSSSGGALDLTPMLDLKVSCRLREVWVHGTAPLKGLAQIDYDFLVVPSNFIRKAVRDEWGISPGRIFVAYNGVLRRKRRYWPPRAQQRDPFRLIYCSHPSKGLESTKAVLRLLRAADRRFHLDVYGGNRMYGGEEEELEPEPGMAYHGLVGQRRLALEQDGSSFSLNLQARLEPFGMVVTESMAAGNILLASPVGAYPEIIRHGYDGFLVPGDHGSPETQARAAALILDLIRHPDFADYIRRHAISAPIDWDTMARAWTGHWTWAFGQAKKSGDPSLELNCSKCPECTESQLPLADGFHCIGCGRYDRALNAFDFHGE